MIAEGVF